MSKELFRIRTSWYVPQITYVDFDSDIRRGFFLLCVCRIQVIWLERRGLRRQRTLHGGDIDAAGRRGHRRLSARCGPTAARAPRTAVAIARSRVSAPWAPVTTGVRRETAERGPRLAEVPRRAESALERFSDAPGGIEASALLRLWGSHP
jgi:hypothetical protein